MKLLESTKNKITKDESDENEPQTNYEYEHLSVLK